MYIKTVFFMLCVIFTSCISLPHKNTRALVAIKVDRQTTQKPLIHYSKGKIQELSNGWNFITVTPNTIVSISFSIAKNGIPQNIESRVIDSFKAESGKVNIYPAHIVYRQLKKPEYKPFTIKEIKQNGDELSQIARNQGYSGLAELHILDLDEINEAGYELDIDPQGK